MQTYSRVDASFLGMTKTSVPQTCSRVDASFLGMTKASNQDKRVCPTQSQKKCLNKSTQILIGHYRKLLFCVIFFSRCSPYVLQSSLP